MKIKYMIIRSLADARQILLKRLQAKQWSIYQLVQEMKRRKATASERAVYSLLSDESESKQVDKVKLSTLSEVASALDLKISIDAK